MSMRFTILGCGSSMGVPRVALGWGACDPNNPKNRRRRCSLLVERFATAGKTAVLVDCSPDLREQLLGAEIDNLDGVLITHDHADHTHGIDDLRGLFVRNRRRLDVYMDDRHGNVVQQRFNYVFQHQPGSDYPPMALAQRLVAGEPLEIDGQGGPIPVLPVSQEHGDIASLGFRFGSIAYSCDVKALPPDSVAALAGLDIWIVDALRIAPHPSHMNLSEALEWIDRVRPNRAILTNLHTDLDYEALRRQVPPGVEPAYDGMQVDFELI